MNERISIFSKFIWKPHRNSILSLFVRVVIPRTRSGTVNMDDITSEGTVPVLNMTKTPKCPLLCVELTTASNLNTQRIWMKVNPLKKRAAIRNNRCGQVINLHARCALTNYIPPSAFRKSIAKPSFGIRLLESPPSKFDSTAQRLKRTIMRAEGRNLSDP